MALPSAEKDKRFIVQCGDRADDFRGFDTEAEVFKYLKDDASDDHKHTVFEQVTLRKLFTVEPRKDYGFDD